MHSANWHLTNTVAAAVIAALVHGVATLSDCRDRVFVRCMKCAISVSTVEKGPSFVWTLTSARSNTVKTFVRFSVPRKRKERSSVNNIASRLLLFSNLGIKKAKWGQESLKNANKIILCWVWIKDALFSMHVFRDTSRVQSSGCHKVRWVEWRASLFHTQ